MAKSLQEIREMDPRHRAALGVVIAVSLAIITVAQRDLAHRPAAEVRGPKALWHIVCLNALGALCYLRCGRRPAGDS